MTADLDPHIDTIRAALGTAYRTCLNSVAYHLQREGGLSQLSTDAINDVERLQGEMGKIDAALASLEAPATPRQVDWTPLPDGEYEMPSSIPNRSYTLLVCYDGAELEAWSNDPDNQYDDGSPRHVEEIGIGDMRLCRRTPTPQPMPSDAQEDCNGAQ